MVRVPAPQLEALGADIARSIQLNTDIRICWYPVGRPPVPQNTDSTKKDGL